MSQLPCLPEWQFVLIGRVSDQIFPIWVKCKGCHWSLRKVFKPCFNTHFLTPCAGMFCIRLALNSYITIEPPLVPTAMRLVAVQWDTLTGNKKSIGLEKGSPGWRSELVERPLTMVFAWGGCGPHSAGLYLQHLSRGPSSQTRQSLWLWAVPLRGAPLLYSLSGRASVGWHSMSVH